MYQLSMPQECLPSSSYASGVQRLRALVSGSRELWGWTNSSSKLTCLLVLLPSLHLLAYLLIPQHHLLSPSICVHPSYIHHHWTCLCLNHHYVCSGLHHQPAIPAHASVFTITAHAHAKARLSRAWLSPAQLSLVLTLALSHA